MTKREEGRDVSCASCWYFTGQPQNECRRRSPLPNPGGPYAEGCVTGWPVVRDSDWCGEYFRDKDKP